MHLAVLFLSAFAAATILPMSSEVVLGGLAVARTNDLWLLLAVATAGNALGAMVNWGLGRYAARWRTRVTGEHDLPARHGTGEKSRRQRPVGEESAMLGTSNPRSSTSSRRPPSATRSNERPLSDQRTVTP
jgi:hypothetical protein